MNEIKEQLLEVAKQRGYDLHTQSGDRNWYGFMHNRYPISLEIWIDTQEFKLSHAHGMLVTSTGKCGSFISEVHFKRFEDWMLSAILKLKAVN